MLYRLGALVGPAELHGSARLFFRGRLVRAVTSALDGVYSNEAAPRPGPPNNMVALYMWAHTVCTGALTNEGVRFTACVYMPPTTHMVRVQDFHCKFHCPYCSAPSYRSRGPLMARLCDHRGARGVPCGGACPSAQ